MFAYHQSGNTPMNQQPQIESPFPYNDSKEIKRLLMTYDDLISTWETNQKQCDVLFRKAVRHTDLLCRTNDTYQVCFKKGKNDYCRTVWDDLLIQNLDKYHYYDLYRYRQQCRESINQLRIQISKPLADRLFRTLARLSPNYEAIYQSFKSIDSPPVSSFQPDFSFDTAVRVGSVLRLKKSHPIRLSVIGTIPIVRQFKQIFHHILSQSIFIPRDSLVVAEMILTPKNSCFLKPDTILLSRRATVFDLMAEYMHFIEYHNERLATNISAFQTNYPELGPDLFANGVTTLFSNPVELADCCRDYFNFIIASLRGDLT